MKKSLVISIICIILIIFIVFIFVRSCTFKKDENVESFLNGDYKKHNGGREAKLFFEKYIDLNNYRDIAFHFSDAGKRLSIYKCWTVYVVDVYYEQFKFYEIAGKYLNGSNESSTCDLLPDVEGFKIKIISEDTDLEDKNSYSIMFDESTLTIRYVFVYKSGMLTKIGIVTAIERAFNLNWNSRGKDDSIIDPIFNY